MEVNVLEEHGHENALRGMAYSYKDRAVPICEWWTHDRYVKMCKTAMALAHKGGGHNKFLESIVVWIDVEAPRYFWSEFDTYRVGTTKQSESTMHTLSKRDVYSDDFATCCIPQTLLNEINACRDTDIQTLKGILPESYLQRRLVCTNYKTLQNMYTQRINHRLPEWQAFCNAIMEQLEFPEYICKE